jgi:predicted ABC-type ATPase
VKRRRRGVIRVLAGTNGAGKSSVAGAHLRAAGAGYFNPDEVARELFASGAVESLAEANAEAWKRGADELRRAIVGQADFTFETTLGGNTIPQLLETASDEGLEVHVWYVGLESAALHVQRVRERVAAGGHDIPEAKIRERYDRSRENLIRLLPGLSSLHLFDNSAPPDAETGFVEPRLLLKMEGRKIVEIAPDADIPYWAQQIVIAARALS